MALNTTGKHHAKVQRIERRPDEETDRIGTEIYERDIRHLVEADHVGKIVAIDVDTGTWGMDDELMAARQRLREKRPEAVNVLLERVGYEAVVGFAGAPRRRKD